MKSRKDFANICDIESCGGIDVHRRPPLEREIHRRYGLCILSGAVVTAPRNGFRTTRPRRFEFYSLSHLIDGKGYLWLGNASERVINCGDAVLICPDDLNRYGGYGNECYTEEVITFCGPVADMMRAAGVIHSGVYHLGTPRLLKPIILAAKDPADSAQINACFALQQLLIEMYNRNRAPKRRNLAKLDEVINAIKLAPERWWTVEEMAKSCDLSVNQFRRNFLHHTGILPKEYVEHCKLRQAAELLVSDQQASIEQIAARMGYFDKFHFSRRFRQLFAMPPGRYRRLFER